MIWSYPDYFSSFAYKLKKIHPNIKIIYDVHDLEFIKNNHTDIILIELRKQY